MVRIEDTNSSMSAQIHVDGIFEMLDWLGLDFDGEAVFQSRRQKLYDRAVERLLESGAAYRHRGAVRFAVPKEGTTSFHDVIRGPMAFDNGAIEDFVLRRANSEPTFYTANAVDDLEMGITHVVRGEDLLVTTPKVLLLREALGGEDDMVFAHLPLIVNKQRKKMAKRRDDAALFGYRDIGILPGAMVNYLSLLGWGPSGNAEVRSVRDTIGEFDLSRVNRSPAMFDADRLIAMNATYVRSLGDRELAEAVLPWVRDTRWGSRLGTQDLCRVSPLIRERVRVLSDAAERMAFLFCRPEINEDDWDATMTGAAEGILLRAEGEFRSTRWDAESLHGCLKSIGGGFGLKLGEAQGPVRVAVTGRSVGLPLFESMALLGRDETLFRIGAALDRLSG